MRTTKKTHKFLVFLIIILIINAIITPFSYKVVKNIMLSTNAITEVSAPEVIEYNYSDQEFANMLFQYERYVTDHRSENAEYYFYLGDLLEDFCKAIDESIKTSETFNSRNEYLTYLEKTNYTSKTSKSNPIIYTIASYNHLTSYTIEKEINDKKVYICFLSSNISLSETRKENFYNSYIKEEVETFFSK